MEYSEHIAHEVLAVIWEKVSLLIDWVYKQPGEAIKEADVSTAFELQVKIFVDIDFDFSW
ncbi:hypothetical protein [Chitinophaga sp. LS1]|uniref:hypothetical protein n=1 Tax=Chitinophaga sp. LS1 TaxID=3051176 RepID=UPI002AABA5E5|nr:hypothetical protein [Chitinophaga sp. LS1]WPV64583.1 hypothetical protein QQL36_22530 [Chitinophaga sp. LS1]